MIECKPATLKTWNDLELLFGEKGACGGCWCMSWRLKRSIFNEQKGEKNRQALLGLIKEGHVPGLIAYLDKKPVGWCSVAPREEFPVLDNSKILARVDQEKVWSVVCMFVSKAHRKQGLSVEMLKAATAYVKRQGGKIVEGYPIIPSMKKTPDAFAWVGVFSGFEKAGFKEVLRRSPNRPIVRFKIS